jgi:hypothetical protein
MSQVSIPLHVLQCVYIHTVQIYSRDAFVQKKQIKDEGIAILLQGNPQFSVLALSVALAGTVAGICWILKALLVDSWRVADGDQMIGFWAVFFKKNFFWKVLLLIYVHSGIQSVSVN